MHSRSAGSGRASQGPVQELWAAQLAPAVDAPGVADMPACMTPCKEVSTAAAQQALRGTAAAKK